MTLLVSDIQHFSTGDGPGIRTTVFLKGCPLRCPWCHNPETISREPQTLVYPQTGKTVTYGREMTVEEVLADVMEDEDFYLASGGGVTVSGGEPLLQAEGVKELACALKERGVPVLIDTAGCVPYDAFEAVLPYTERFFFDYKSDSPDDYRQLIGGSHELILSNLARLIEVGAKVHVRIPLIPDVNATPEMAKAICRRLKAIGVTRVDLLPFHRMGSGKYEAMGLTYRYKNQEPLSDDTIRTLKSIYETEFETTVEGGFQ
jgi:pyruvate formate lyase activating enzyme